ncbi:MAG: 50S ribosomal protein L29 [Candidatus Sumerlaeia bacterium]|nr:50S ribosomal protein L29 [Candidatus Sumerlaeia bacterium]
MADVQTNEQLRKQSVQDLELRLQESKRDAFRLRVKATTKELSDTSAIRKKRREIARILTVLNEKSSS